MALFKISKGSKNNLPATLTEGYCWYTFEDSKFYIDHKDENGVLTRKALNAQEAEKITGYDIATILNFSDVEIPTSKAVLDALDELKAELTTQDAVILAEAQAYTDDALAQAKASGEIVTRTELQQILNITNGVGIIDAGKIIEEGDDTNG